MLHMYHAEFPQVELWKMHNMLQQFESQAQLLYVCVCAVKYKKENTRI